MFYRNRNSPRKGREPGEWNNPLETCGIQRVVAFKFLEADVREEGEEDVHRDVPSNEEDYFLVEEKRSITIVNVKMGKLVGKVIYHQRYLRKWGKKYTNPGTSLYLAWREK